MEKNSRIGHLTLIGKIDVVMEEHSSIGRGNWIVGFPTGEKTHYEEVNRDASLIMGEHSAITHRHFIDCTDRVTIGKFSTIAGLMSQIMTHSIDLKIARQSCRPISVGSYCFVGTRVILLGGCDIPDYSVLGAGSLLGKKIDETYCLLGGIPAKKIKSLPSDLAYFTRKDGYIL